MLHRDTPSTGRRSWVAALGALLVYGVSPWLLDFWTHGQIPFTATSMALTPVPVVAAITGHCIASGTLIAAFADYRIASSGNWHIGLNEVQAENQGLVSLRAHVPQPEDFPAQRPIAAADYQPNIAITTSTSRCSQPPPPTATGLFHLAILHLAGDQPAQARATAEQILADAPDHILALGVAGAAAQEADDQEAARAFYRRLLDAYPAEAARPLPEYLDHQRMLPEYRRAAAEALGEDG